MFVVLFLLLLEIKDVSNGVEQPMKCCCCPCCVWFFALDDSNNPYESCQAHMCQGSYEFKLVLYILLYIFGIAYYTRFLSITSKHTNIHEYSKNPRLVPTLLIFFALCVYTNTRNIAWNRSILACMYGSETQRPKVEIWPNRLLYFKILTYYFRQQATVVYLDNNIFKCIGYQ